MHMLWVLFYGMQNEIKVDWKKILPSPSCSMAWSEEVEARSELWLGSGSLRSRLDDDLWDLRFLNGFGQSGD